VAAATCRLCDERQRGALVQAAQFGGGGGRGGVAEDAAALQQAGAKQSLVDSCITRAAQMRMTWKPVGNPLTAISRNATFTPDTISQPHAAITPVPLQGCGASQAPGRQSSAECIALTSSAAPAGDMLQAGSTAGRTALGVARQGGLTARGRRRERTAFNPFSGSVFRPRPQNLVDAASEHPAAYHRCHWLLSGWHWQSTSWLVGCAHPPCSTANTSSRCLRGKLIATDFK
jgi:hypothetical protein